VTGGTVATGAGVTGVITGGCASPPPQALSSTTLRQSAQDSEMDEVSWRMVALSDREREKIGHRVSSSERSRCQNASL
jgi:hypothetical protein